MLPITVLHRSREETGSNPSPHAGHCSLFWIPSVP